MQKVCGFDAGMGRSACLATLVILVFVLWTPLCGATEGAASVRVYLDESVGAIDPNIYGYFTELTLTGFEGTSWSELLNNRKFGIDERSEKLAWPRSGTGACWEPLVLDTNVSLHLDKVEYYSAPYSQRITLTAPGPGPAGVRQKGYQRVLTHLEESGFLEHPFHFRAGAAYRVRLSIKWGDLDGPVYVALGESPEAAAAQHAFERAGDGWEVYTTTLEPNADAEDASFMIYIKDAGTVWVDSASLVEEALDAGGFRKDAIALTKETASPTNLRWPGGCFADDYHWKDGIGPIDQRPDTYNRAWKSWLTNDVGTDEFVALCRMLDAAPYICVNFGTGTPEEAAAWVEYCNGDTDTKWGKARAENGHPEPYNVKYWNIGNEVYLATEFGATNGREYGRGFRAFARAMRAADPEIRLVAVGTTGIPAAAVPMLRANPGIWPSVRYWVGWTEGLFAEAGDEVDYYSIHYYEPGRVGEATSMDQVNKLCMTISDHLEDKVDSLRVLMSEHAADGRPVPIALDEWANQAEGGPQPPIEAAFPEGVRVPEDLGFYVAAGSLRTALSEAGVMNLMQRRPGDFAIGNKTLLYGYLAGDIGIRRDAVVAAPAALMMGLYATRERCESLKVAVESDTFTVSPARPGNFSGDAPYLDVSARLRDDGRQVDVFVVNRNLEEAMPCALELVGGVVEPEVEVATLEAEDIHMWNGFDEPDKVRVTTKTVDIDGTTLEYPFAKHSVTKLTFRARQEN